MFPETVRSTVVPVRLAIPKIQAFILASCEPPEENPAQGKTSEVFADPTSEVEELGRLENSQPYPIAAVYGKRNAASR